MTEYKHPMRELEIMSYSPNDKGQPFIAYIGSVGNIAMHFTGDSITEAIEKASDFKWKSIRENEEAYINKKTALEEMHRKRKDAKRKSNDTSE